MALFMSIRPSEGLSISRTLHLPLGALLTGGHRLVAFNLIGARLEVYSQSISEAVPQDVCSQRT
jgi:hypothetical protein